jgi:hypothetical protein
MAIENWMPALKNKMAAIPGIKQVHQYDEIPGTLLTFPCLIIMPTRGSQSYSASGPAVAIHQVQMTLYVAGQILPEGYAVAVPFIQKIRDALAANVTLDGTVSYIAPPAPPESFYEGPGAIGFNYGDKNHLGVIFRVVVKETETVNVSA